MKHLILGNGPAGVVAAETLRHAAPADEIVMTGCEQAPPYARMDIPRLLAGGMDESAAHLRRAPGHFPALRVRQLHGRAVALDTARRRVLFDDGSVEDYQRLLIATGAHPVRPLIPGIDLPGVLTCWTLEDARAIAQRAQPGTRVLLLGAGLVGCALIGALAARGVELTVAERGDRIAPGMLPAGASAMVGRWVAGRGVRVLTAVRVRCIGGGSPLRVTLGSGEAFDCDLVVAAAGGAPNVGFLADTGVYVSAGVVVDDRLETSVPGIFAAGDVAEAPDFFTGEPVLAAGQANAAAQARVAALNMAGHGLRLGGVLAENTLDVMGLATNSFGQWRGIDAARGGAGVECADEAGRRYLNLQFRHDVLIGATAIGCSGQAEALRSLILRRIRLGLWRDRLLAAPLHFADAAAALGRAPANEHQMEHRA